MKKFIYQKFWSQEQLNQAITEELNKLHDLIKKLEPELDLNRLFQSSATPECNCNGTYTGIPCVQTCPLYRSRRGRS